MPQVITGSSDGKNGEDSTRWLELTSSESQVQNAVASICLPVYGTQVQDVVMDRIEGYPNDPVIFDADPGDYEDFRGPEPPPRLPSALPPPGNLHLELRLDKLIGSGRSGAVYQVSVCIDKSSPEVSSLFIPPLVAKISQRYRNEDLEHEMYNYEELESLQGVVVPRCYGLFEGKVPRTHTILPPEKVRDAKDEASNNRPTPRGLNGVVCVLLLERLGDRLPIGQPLPEGILCVIPLLDNGAPSSNDTSAHFTFCPQ